MKTCRTTDGQPRKPEQKTAVQRTMKTAKQEPWSICVNKNQTKFLHFASKIDKRVTLHFAEELVALDGISPCFYPFRFKSREVVPTTKL